MGRRIIIIAAFIIAVLCLNACAADTDSQVNNGIQSNENAASEKVSYSIQADGKDFSTDGTVDVESSDFILSLQETVNDDEASEEDFLEGNIEDHIVSISYDAEQTRRDGTTVVTAEYSFSEVESGTIIDIEITGDLQEKLGLDTNMLQINVK